MCALLAVLAVVSQHRRSASYDEAIALAEAGNAERAYEILSGLGDYRDAQERARSLVDRDPALPYRRAAKGDGVVFGSYEQDGDPSNGPEPIRWTVVDRLEDRILVLSAECLEGRQYHHVPFEDASWQNSDLRAWMNGDFRETAFTPAESALIVPADNANDPQSITGAGGGAPTTDHIFALSETEGAIYLGDEASRDSLGVAATTDHAKGTGLPVDENGSCDWWLRSPGTYGFAAQFVDATGMPSVSGANVDAVYGARPALWISTGGAGGAQ
nr:DUF6273 domain-containing protein [Schaalia georgiae]